MLAINYVSDFGGQGIWLCLPFIHCTETYYTSPWPLPCDAPSVSPPLWPPFCIPIPVTPLLYPLPCDPSSSSPTLWPLFFIPSPVTPALWPLFFIPSSVTPLLYPLLCDPSSLSPPLWPLSCTHLDETAGGHNDGFGYHGTAIRTLSLKIGTISSVTCFQGYAIAQRSFTSTPSVSIINLFTTENVHMHVCTNWNQVTDFKWFNFFFLTSPLTLLSKINQSMFYFMSVNSKEILAPPPPPPPPQEIIYN